jgi:hypothetical protein
VHQKGQRDCGDAWGGEGQDEEEGGEEMEEAMEDAVAPDGDAAPAFSRWRVVATYGTEMLRHKTLDSEAVGYFRLEAEVEVSAVVEITGGQTWLKIAPASLH